MIRINKNCSISISNGNDILPPLLRNVLGILYRTKLEARTFKVLGIIDLGNETSEIIVGKSSDMTCNSQATIVEQNQKKIKSAKELP